MTEENPTTEAIEESLGYNITITKLRKAENREWEQRIFFQHIDDLNLKEVIRVINSLGRY